MRLSMLWLQWRDASCPFGAIQHFQIVLLSCLCLKLCLLPVDQETVGKNCRIPAKARVCNAEMIYNKDKAPFAVFKHLLLACSQWTDWQCTCFGSTTPSVLLTRALFMAARALFGFMLYRLYAAKTAIEQKENIAGICGSKCLKCRFKLSHLESTHLHLDSLVVFGYDAALCSQIQVFKTLERRKALYF